jgi:hypothetical protein
MPKGTKSVRAAAPPAARRRIQLGLIVSAETKATIEAEANRSGLTQSQIAERLIERALTYDRTVAAMNATLDEIRRRNVHAAMMREGYHPLRTRHGMAYLPPATPFERSSFQAGQPGEPPPATPPERSGFQAWQPGELEALGIEAVEVPSSEPLPNRTAEAMADLKARLAKLEALVRKQSEPEQDQ